jgi:hypothetical protein
MVRRGGVKKDEVGWVNWWSRCNPLIEKSFRRGRWSDLIDIIAMCCDRDSLAPITVEFRCGSSLCRVLGFKLNPQTKRPGVESGVEGGESRMLAL